MSITDAVIYTSTGSTGLIADVVQLILERHGENRNKSIFGYSLLRLNIADILASLIVLLLGVANTLAKCRFIDDSLFEELSNTLIELIIFSLISSFTHVIFIAIQRFIAVASPLRVKQIITKTRCRIILATLWLVSIALVLIACFYEIVSVAFVYLIITTAVMLIVMYSIICFKTLKRGVVNIENEEMRRRRQRSNKDVLLYSVSITCIFIISTVPSVIGPYFIAFPPVIEILNNVFISLNPFFDTLLYFA